MKNIFIYTILIFVFACCSKGFLSLNPETQINTGTFYKTEAQFQQALAGVYQSLRGYAEISGWLMGEMRSDNANYDYNPQARSGFANELEQVCDFVDDDLNAESAQKYINDYIGIARANSILDRIDGSDLTEDAKKSITAETKFLRAFFYFDLVQFYGGVPLHLHEVANPSQAFLARSPVDSVYTAIVGDLKDAITKFPSTVTFPQKGRASIGSAKTLLANVYMVQKKFPEAEALLKDVTALGYQLLPDYASVYALNNKNSKESIFEIQYKQGTAEGQASSFIYHFIPIMSNTLVVTGVVASTSSGSAGAGLNYPTQSLLNAYEPGDARLNASIGIIEGKYSGSFFVAEKVLSIVGYTTPSGKVSKYFLRKYLHAHTEPLSTDDNWPVYRYSEALLFLAEALNEQNKSAEALPYLNQVRVPRTGLSAITETNQSALRKIIAHERRIELAFENKRWTDLLRTGEALSVMTAFGDSMKTKITYPLWPNAYNVTQNRLLFPFPRTEMQVNSLLVQNPGY